jgi:hypothetical protein
VVAGCILILLMMRELLVAAYARKTHRQSFQLGLALLLLDQLLQKWLAAVE